MPVFAARRPLPPLQGGHGACRLVEGATHGFTPCTACAKTPGGFGDTVGETFGYASDWLHKNYGD